MSKHAEKLRAQVNNHLGEIAKELMEDPRIDLALRIKVMDPFSNAVSQLQVAIGLLEREKPVEEVR